MTGSRFFNTPERVSVGVTVALTVILVIAAAVSASRPNALFWLGLSVGGLGGLMHEFAQSGGKILFFQKHEDGLYLGSVSGIILGAVAGLLVLRGHFMGTGADMSATQLTYEVFMAGLALKGVSEAATGNSVGAAEK